MVLRNKKFENQRSCDYSALTSIAQQGAAEAAKGTCPLCISPAEGTQHLTIGCDPHLSVLEIQK